MRIAGVMSGTSLDGIDVAVVEVKGRVIETIGFLTTPYSKTLRLQILAVDGPEGLSRLNFQLGELYARAVLRAIRRFGTVGLIGCHGQTVYHEGGAHTLQIGEAAVLAERTGIPVVSNFRARDIAAGGQGAPLVPYVDYLLFRHRTRTRVVLNIGGIANITVIPAGARPAELVAFDTGPGNMVIDALAPPYDRNGKLAASGRVNVALLDELLADPYYRRKPPKSAGREQYGAEFVETLRATGLPRRDLVATATVLTAATIAMGVSQRGRPSPFVVCQPAAECDLVVSGGGVHNPQILGHIAAFLPGVRISTSTDHGIDADAKEAIAFAVLAYETWRRRPSNLPSATGARRAVVLGSITP